MTKKATTSNAITADALKVSRRRPSTLQAAVGSSAAPEMEASPELCAAVGASEEEALNSLLSSITDTLGDHGGDKAHMHEFLSLILDTDPALKEEILRGIRVSK